MKELEDTYGPKWRNGNAREIRTWQRRNKWFQAIKKKMRLSDMSAKQAIAFLEKIQADNGWGMTMMETKMAKEEIQWA